MAKCFKGKTLWLELVGSTCAIILCSTPDAPTAEQAHACAPLLTAPSAAAPRLPLQVSEQGEILYVFKPGFRESLQGRSLALKLEPVAAAVWQGISYLGRVAFGTALITSGGNGDRAGDGQVMRCAGMQ